MIKQLVLFVTLISSIQPSFGDVQGSTEVTLAQIRAKYDSLSSMSADVEQVKTGIRFKKPLHSTIRLSRENDLIRWEIIKPAPTTILVDAKSVSILGPNDQKPKILSAAEGDKFKDLFTFIRALVSGDYPTLENQFKLNLINNELTATPKNDSSLRFISSFKILFTDDALIRRLEINTTDETTVLNFKNLTLTAAPSRK